MLSRREWFFLTALFVVSLPAVTARLYSSDEVQYFSYLRSLWFDHDVSFENEYQYFFDHQIAQTPDFHTTFLELDTAAHRRINYGTIGCAILWSPFYAVGDASARVMRAAGRDVAVDGYTQPYISAVAYGSAFYGFATIVLSIIAARRLAGGHAVGSGIAIWLGTPLLFYMYIAPPFSHACSAFAVALFVTVWLHVRETWSVRGAVALGLAGALMAMVREQDIFFALGPVLDFALALINGQGKAPAAPASRDQPPPRLRRSAGASAKAEVGERERPGVPASAGHEDSRPATARSRRSAPGSFAREGGGPREQWKMRDRVLAALAGCLAFALGYLPQLIAYQALNGRPRPSPLVMRKMFWHAPHALQVLADNEHGFFFWTPLAVLAVAGLILMTVAPASTEGESGTGVAPSDVRRIGGCMLLMTAAQVYVSGAVESWTVAGAFGQRRFVAVTILLVIGLATLRARIRGNAVQVAANVAIGLCIWWNLALIAEFGTSMMDRQRLELRKNAYDAFVTLPRMAPRLMYRYFAERASFYKPAEPER
jgi:hypothetical protein